MQGIFVTGTNTDVGKTWVGRHLIKAFVRNGVDVLPRKPVESGWSEDVTKTDAWLLANAAGKTNLLEQICPNHFKKAISPARAAQAEGLTLSIDTIYQQCVEQLEDSQFLYVEGAGGFYSPICNQGLNADLAARLDLPVLLVVDNYLGCINHTLLTIEAIQKRSLGLLAIVLNNSSENDCIDMDNFHDLKNLIEEVPIVQIKHNEGSLDPFDELYKLAPKLEVL